MTQKQANYYFIRGYMEKKAQLVEKNTPIPFEEAYGKPLPKKRKLTKEELESIAYSKWVTKYPWRRRSKDRVDNSLTGYMVDPKAPLIPFSMLFGGLGSVLGALAASGPRHSNDLLTKLKGAGVGGLLGTLSSLPISYAIGKSINKDNKRTENAIRRLPPGSTSEDWENMYPGETGLSLELE